VKFKLFKITKFRVKKENKFYLFGLLDDFTIYNIEIPDNREFNVNFTLFEIKTLQIKLY